MKCSNCGQEIIDMKDYCVSCGKKLRENKKSINIAGLLGIFACVIIITIVGCYLIINLNTDKEIEPYLNNNTEETR